MRCVFLALLCVSAQAQYKGSPCPATPQCTDADLAIVKKTAGWFGKLTQAGMVSMGNRDKAIKSLKDDIAKNNLGVSDPCATCQAESTVCGFGACGFTSCSEPGSKKCLTCGEENCALRTLCGVAVDKINIPTDKEGKSATWVKDITPKVKCLAAAGAVTAAGTTAAPAPAKAAPSPAGTGASTATAAPAASGSHTQQPLQLAVFAALMRALM